VAAVPPESVPCDVHSSPSTTPVTEGAVCPAADVVPPFWNVTVLVGDDVLKVPAVTARMATELKIPAALLVNVNPDAAASVAVATFVHTFTYGCPPDTPASDPASVHPAGAPMDAKAPSLSA
jgi:hypothetical protein